MPLSATVSTTLCALGKASAAFHLVASQNSLFDVLDGGTVYLERSDVLAALILTS